MLACAGLRYCRMIYIALLHQDVGSDHEAPSVQGRALARSIAATGKVGSISNDSLPSMAQYRAVPIAAAVELARA